MLVVSLYKSNLSFYLMDFSEPVTRFVLEFVDEKVIDGPGRLICSDSQTQVRTESCQKTVQHVDEADAVCDVADIKHLLL